MVPYIYRKEALSFIKCKVSVKLRNENRGIIMLQDEGNLELDTYLMLKGIVKKETETGLIMK